MINWLKFTFLSFFINKEAKNGAKRSLWNVLLALFLVVILMSVFLASGLNYSFKTHYGKASEFKEFVYANFANENVDERLNYVAELGDDEDTYLTIFKGTNKDNSVVINTIANSLDKSTYSKNGYDLVVDTRDSASTFYAFDAIYANSSDSSITINEDQYNNLTATEKSNYAFSSYTIKNEEIILTLEDTTTRLDYLTPIWQEKDSDDTYYSVWESIVNHEDKTSSSYMASIYSLYLYSYYGITSAPTNKLYYQNTYCATDSTTGDYVYKNFLILCDNWAMMSFTNDKCIEITYDGFYTDIEDGSFLFDSSNANDITSIKNNVDIFLVNIVTSVYSIRTLLVGIQIFKLMPYLIVVMAVLALFLLCICKIRKRLYADSFGKAFKIISSLLIGTSFISGLGGFILSFFMDSTNSFSLGIWGFLMVLSIRLFILVIIEEIAYKKNPLRDGEKVVINEDNLSDDNEGKSHIDLSTTDTGTKVIVNDKVSEDEEETMDLMK